MISPDLSGLTATYRQPASGRSFVLLVLVVSAGAALVVGPTSRAPLGVQVVAFACFAVAAGLIARRVQPATRLTREGVRRRRFASRWHLIEWDEVVGVDPQPDSGGDPVLLLRSGGRVHLDGVVPATAETLGARLADRGRTT